MKPFPNRTGIFQRIRLSIAREFSLQFSKIFNAVEEYSSLETSRLWSFAL